VSSLEANTEKLMVNGGFLFQTGLPPGPNAGWNPLIAGLLTDWCEMAPFQKRSLEVKTKLKSLIAVYLYAAAGKNIIGHAQVA